MPQTSAGLAKKNDLFIDLHTAEAVVQGCCAKMHEVMACLMSGKPAVDAAAAYVDRRTGSGDADLYCDKEDARTLATMIERVSYIIEVMSANTLADVVDPGGK